MKFVYAVVTRALSLILMASLASGAMAYAPPVDPTLRPADFSNILHLPIIGYNFIWADGSVYGVVTDASTGSPLLNVDVCAAPGVCTQTNDLGAYSFSLPQGALVLHAALDGYFAVDKAAFAVASRDREVNISMSPSISGENIVLRVVLTWSANPTYGEPPNEFENDLDAHMWVMPAGVNETFICHIQPFGNNSVDCPQGDMYGGCTVYPYACMETQVRRGSGPETISVGEILTDTETQYYYGVLNYNQNQAGVPPLNETGAHVDVYNETGLLYSFDPPQGAGGNFWYLLRVEGQTGLVTPVNCIVDFNPVNHHAFPEASPPCGSQ